VFKKISDPKGQANLGIIAALFLSVLVLFMLFLGFPLENVLLTVLGSFCFIVAFVNTDIALIILILSMLLSPEFTAGQVTGREVKIRATASFICLQLTGSLS
jgi:hypothetical protein